MKAVSERKNYIDLIRIIAIYMVLFNHTGKDGYLLFTAHKDSAFYPLFLVNAILIKIAVPLFFMASGVLLLKKEEDYRSLLKRFFRFFVELLAASFVFYLYSCFRLGERTFSFGEFLTLVYSFPVSSAFWYLYTYLAYILMLPFLRSLARNLEAKDFMWLFVMNGILSFLPIPEWIIWRGAFSHYSGFGFFFTISYFFYPLIGYYMGCRLKDDELRSSTLLLLTGLSFLSLILCSLMTHWKCSFTGEWQAGACETFFNTMIYLPACTVFYAVRFFFTKRSVNDKTAHILRLLGSSTFGLYLLERICRVETKPVFDFLDRYTPTIIACWIWILTACVLGIIVTLVLKSCKRLFVRIIHSGSVME